MKNDYLYGDLKISIPPTVLFSIIGPIEDVRKAVTMDAKAAGNLVYILGETRDELGGSEYFALYGHIGTTVPKVAAAPALRLYQDLHEAIQRGLIRSCHDCSDGGLGVALAETAFSGGLGMQVDLRRVPATNIDRNDVILFSETQSRFVVTVAPELQQEFEQCMKRNIIAEIGRVTEGPAFKILGRKGASVVATSTYDLQECWQKTLRF